MKNMFVFFSEEWTVVCNPVLEAGAVLDPFCGAFLVSAQFPLMGVNKVAFSFSRRQKAVEITGAHNACMKKSESFRLGTFTAV